MKNLKKILVAGAMVIAIGTTSITAFAKSAYKNPAEAVAGLTNRTVESVVDERKETGKTYGKIADEAGVLDKFKSENLEMKKENLAAQVEEGKITQEKADQIIAAIEKNKETCDGTGSEKIGQKLGAKFGSNGTGLGKGNANRGKGKGRGQGGEGRRMGKHGMGLRDGSCLVNEE